MAYKNRLDVNPFFTYIIGFSIALFVYTFDWSYLYPPLSTPLKLFFSLSFIISFTLGCFFVKKKYFIYRPCQNTLNVKILYSFIILGFLAEFAHAGAIPFFAIISGSGFDYAAFGIPTFHVILITFTGFFTIQLFNIYMSTNEKKYLWLCLSLFIFPILIFSRGTFLLNLSSITFVYLFSTNRNKLKIYLSFSVIVMIILLLFGVLGNIRTENQKSGTIDDVNELILLMGDAKPSFEYSSIPREYFWAYLYISSPLANLQLNIDTNQEYKYSVKNFLLYVNTQLNFDFISKRINSTLGWEPLEINMIAEYWVVATAFSYSYSYLGWLGIVLTFCFIMTVSFVYLILLRPSNPYFATGLAILNTMLLFCIFDNMFTFSGLSFQLIYPLLLQFKLRQKI